MRTSNLLLSLSILFSFPLLLFLYFNQQLQITPIVIEPLSGLLRFDTLSTAFFFMVSLIGFVVLRFSKSYLEGDTHYFGFIRKLLITIAFVQVLVLSGNIIVLFLAWVSTGLGLKQLVLNNKERAPVKQVIRKKKSIDYISNTALFFAVSLMYKTFNTGDLTSIFSQLSQIETNQIPLILELAGVLLGVAVIVKSAQIPFHGWLLDIMEAPTPVSAILHAGLLNAGPFLIIRFSYLLEFSSIGSILLLTIGGLSALFGTLVFPTQPAVKTSLAYSSIGHMGFSLMVCGMGLYSAALLHLIAHSLYKAHSFLSSGSAIDKSRLYQMNGSIQFKTNTFFYTILGVVITTILYLLIMRFYGEDHFTSFQITVLGIVIISGVSSFLAKTVKIEHGGRSIFLAILTSCFVLFAFLTLEQFMSGMLKYQIPEVSNPSMWVKVITIALLMSFLGLVLNPFFNGFKIKKSDSKWQVYIRNGFYVHVMFDRLLVERIKN